MSLRPQPRVGGGLPRHLAAQGAELPAGDGVGVAELVNLLQQKVDVRLVLWEILVAIGLALFYPYEINAEGLSQSGL